MKKTLAIFMALALVGTAFAVDVKASLKIDGSAYGTKGMSINNTDTQDDDNLTFAVSGKMAGAAFRIHGAYASTDASVSYKEPTAAEALAGSIGTFGFSKGSLAVIRKGSIWFKPVDQLKITIGDTGWAMTKEQIDWWRGTNGAVVGRDWDNNDNIATSTSFLAEANPVAGLNLMLGLDDDMKANDDNTAASFADVTPFALGGTYAIDQVGIIGAAYKHVGKDVDLIRASFEVTAVKDLKAFAKLTLRQDIAKGEDTKKLNGIGVDLYGAYNADKFGIKALVPFVIRQDTNNKSICLYYDVRAQYALTGFTPYIRLRDTMKLSGDVAAVKTDDNEAINPDILIAATWNIEVAAFDCGFEYITPAQDGKGEWKLPFSVRVSY